MRFRGVAALLLVASCSRPVLTPLPDSRSFMRETRGVWIATVRNIDWPKDTTSPERQRAELIDLLDRAAAAGFNVVVFQVRSASDAVYHSQLEPWAALLTGRQGTDPGYDPLELAISEAHARGLELHAWINPFRAGNAADTLVLAPNHVWNARRDLVRVYGSQLWLDPGEPDAREHTARVIRDIVQRYDVDGIHVDDYFYPYPVNDSARKAIPFPDSASYARSGSTLPVDDWRRENMDKFVERMYRDAHEIKPMIKVGISPFGIWRPNYPPNVCCFDAYASLYADSRKWLQAGWVDYFTPQLYWSIAAERQSFPALLDWWIGENTMRRHLWPGLASYRAAARTNGFALDEIRRQIELIRARPMPPGEIMFNASTTLKRPEFLATIRPLYKERALVPAFPWLDSTASAAPMISVSERTVSMTAAEKPRWWLVQAERPGGLFRRRRSISILVFGDSTRVTLPFAPSRVQVSAIDAAGNVSVPAAQAR